LNEPLVAVVFVGYGLAVQAVLIAFFAARRWAPARADGLGWLSYGCAGSGLLVAVWLVWADQPMRLWVGPLLWAAWAGLGGTVDLWRAVPWRHPIRVAVFVPYVVLYFFAQMFMWWPLWDVAFTAWLVYALLFVANTAMNFSGHSGGEQT